MAVKKKKMALSNFLCGKHREALPLMDNTITLPCFTHLVQGEVGSGGNRNMYYILEGSFCHHYQFFPMHNLQTKE